MGFLKDNYHKIAIGFALMVALYSGALIYSAYKFGSFMEGLNSYYMKHSEVVNEKLYD